MVWLVGCSGQLTLAAYQRVAVCCSVLQCVAVCCSVLQCVAVCKFRSVLTLNYVCHRRIFCVEQRTLLFVMCCNVLQCVAMCYNVLQLFNHIAASLRGTTHINVLHRVTACHSMLQRVAVCCSVLQCAAVCCSVLPRVAVICSYQRTHCVEQHTSRCCTVLHYCHELHGFIHIAVFAARNNTRQGVAVCCNFAVCWSHWFVSPHSVCGKTQINVLQCVAVCCSVLHPAFEKAVRNPTYRGVQHMHTVTYECVTSHRWTSLITHMNARECVYTYIYIGMHKIELKEEADEKSVRNAIYRGIEHTHAVTASNVLLTPLEEPPTTIITVPEAIRDYQR